MDGLDLSILDGMNIPNIETKTTRKETINMPENVDTESDQDSAPISEAEEVDSYEELIKKQNAEDTTRTVVDDETEEDNDEVDDDSDDDFDNSPVDNSKDDEDAKSKDSIVKIWSEWAKDKGLIDYTDEEFEDSEDFLEKKYTDKVKKGVESYKQELPDVIKHIIDNYEDGVPLVDLIESTSRIMEYASIDPSALVDDEQTQEYLVRNWLSVQEFEEEEIDDKIADYKDSGLMEKEARTALNKLQKNEYKYQQELKQYSEEQKYIQEKQIEENLKKLESDISSKNEIIEGIQLSKEAKNKVFAGLTKKDSKGYTEIQKKMADPNMQLKVAQFVLLHNGNLDDILKTAKTKIAKETKKEVTTYREKSKLGSVDMSVIKNALRKK